MTPRTTAKEAASLFKDKRTANAIRVRIEGDALRKIATVFRYQIAIDMLERQIIDGASAFRGS